MKPPVGQAPVWSSLTELFACVQLSGRDSLSWLSAISSNRFQELAPGMFCTNAILDKTAKLRVGFYLYLTAPQQYLLISPKITLPALLAVLTEYHFAEQLTFKQYPQAEFISYSTSIQAAGTTATPPAAASPTLSALLNSLHTAKNNNSLSLPAGSLKADDTYFLPAPFTLNAGCDYFLFTPAKHKNTQTPPVTAFLHAHNIPLQQPAAWQQQRLTNGILLFGHELHAGDAILACPEAEKWVATDKGCYPGQEVIARITTRNREVLHKFVAIVFMGAKLPPLHRTSELRTTERSVGNVRAVIHITQTQAQTYLAAQHVYSEASSAAAANTTPVNHSNDTNALLVLALLHKDYYAPASMLNIALPGIAAAAQQHNPVPTPSTADIYTGHVLALPLSSNLSASSAQQLKSLYEAGIKAYHTAQPELARKHFTAVLDIAPKHSDALEALAVLEERSGNHNTAITLNKRLKTLLPTAVMPHTNLSRLYMLKGWIEQAEAEQQQATLMSFKATARSATQQREAEKLLHVRRQRQLELFTKALAIDANDSIALFSLGKLHYEEGLYAKALPHLQRAAHVNPKHAATQLFYGKSLQHLARLAEAQAVFKQGIDIARAQGHLAPLKAMESALASLANKKHSH